MNIRISLGTKFQLKLIILAFWIKIAQTGLKTKKVNSITELCILKLDGQFWMSILIFLLIFVNFDILHYIYPKMAFLIANENRECCHWILHVRIGLGIKFHLKLITSIFWTKFAQKEYFRLKMKEREQQQWVLHICIRLATKFQLKVIILIF